MKLSILLVAFLLILLLATAQGSRLEPGSVSQSYQEMHEERSSNEGSAIGEVVICKDGHCSGTMKRRVVKAVKEPHHRLPGFHEDYYGPRHHKPKHH